ncbi:hypothetical protein AB1Y20_014585 [Prymnesium parvum]|uniref:Exostosin GT47 domain-containing protein n=1 Tax=Prymnesium parvum TaxID=97485 RepID=A0AB34IDB4_PRYPA
MRADCLLAALLGLLVLLYLRASYPEPAAPARSAVPAAARLTALSPRPPVPDPTQHEVCAHCAPLAVRSNSSAAAPLRSCCHQGGAWERSCASEGPRTYASGLRACNLEAGCAVCAVGAARRKNGALDLNCCWPGGSWARHCGPRAKGFAFTFSEGFRVCNGERLTHSTAAVGGGEAVPSPHAVALAADEACAACAEARPTSRRYEPGEEPPLSSCCHEGGAWDGLCGEGGPRTAAAGVRACNAVCARCGYKHTSHEGRDANCCNRGGAWFGHCGPREDGWPFTVEEGYRACNPLTPAEAVNLSTRVAPADFVPLAFWRADVDGRLRGGRQGGESTEASFAAAAEGVDGEAVDSSRQGATRSPSADAGGGMRVYILTLQSRKAVERRWRHQLRRQVHPSRVAAVAGVPAAHALRVAGVALEDVGQVFGAQAGEAEFLAALGCTLGHLRAIERAARDAAAPALVLEDDAVLDLEAHWLAPSLAWFASALPPRWHAVQLAMVARQHEWDALRHEWRQSRGRLRASAQLRTGFFWASAAYMLHPRGVRALLGRYRSTRRRGGRDGSAWELGLARVRCVKADTCVLFPSLPPRAVYLSMPPLFTCAELRSSNIDGHDRGYQQEVHFLSRLQSLDFAAEASRDLADFEPLWAATRAAVQQLAPPRAPLHPLFGTQIESAHAGEARESGRRRGEIMAAQLRRLERTFVLRRKGAARQVVQFGDAGQVLSFNRSDGAQDYHGFAPAGRWLAWGRSLFVQMRSSDGGQEPPLWAFLLQAGKLRQHPLDEVTSDSSSAMARRWGGHSLAGDGADGATNGDGITQLELARLASPAAFEAPGAAAALAFRFWVHDDARLWWLQLLPCTPDWDHEMESQNAAEVWLLLQLLVHPNRTHDWRKASVVVLPLLPKTSFRAGQCLGHTHTERLQLALKAMRSHPAYSRHWGHDHLLLFNYWDAWGVFGKRGSSTHAAMSNVSLGWHETQDVAWGMANHRHVGKCQLVLPYVEPVQCSSQEELELFPVDGVRSIPFFFAGAHADFDTENSCPNVANHSVRVRRTLFQMANNFPRAELRLITHNMRDCNGDSQCQYALKRRAARSMAQSRFCPVASGDTPTTGRLFDAVSCGCVPIIVSDDIQLPFPVTMPFPTAVYGPRLLERVLVADPDPVLRKIVGMPLSKWRALQQRLLTARRLLAYRTPGSLVATLALREASATCLKTRRSTARAPWNVSKC